MQSIISSRIFCLALLMPLFFSFGIQNSLAKDKRSVPSNREQVRYSFAPLVKALAPSVVNVYAARQVQQRSSPFAGDPFFERFFGRDTFGGRPRQRISRSLGSGVVVGENGLVITNHHVIKNADEVKVSLSDGREYAAEILLIDKQSDLAVLKINPDERLPAVILGDSENLEVGDLVLAIGNPFGVGQTVTSGIISALARSQRGIKDFGFFIQTDASINPGNSGGALVGMNGELIGINTAIFSRSGGSNGIGFAVPSNMVRVVLDSARKGSKSLLRPWVGAQFQAVSADIAESLGMQRPTGALVSGVTAGGPAQRAGLKLGDVILSLDGKPIPHVAGLGYRLATAGIGRQVSLTVLTRNQRRVLKISLSQAPEVPARDIQKIGGRSPFSGIVAANLSPRVAQELGMSTEKTGVVIMSVGGRSLAARFGFRAKDILVEINDDTVLNTRILVAISKSRERGWAFTIERNGVRRKQFIR